MRALFAAVCVLLPLSAGAQTPPTLHIEMVEFSFRPPTLHLTAGRSARLELVNRGQIAHQFGTTYLRALSVRIVADTVYAETAGLDFIRLDPGGTARLEFLPYRKGRFAFACTIEGHQEAGMRGVLDVR